MYLAYAVAMTVSMSIATLGLYCVVLDALEIIFTYSGMSMCRLVRVEIEAFNAAVQTNTDRLHEAAVRRWGRGLVYRTLISSTTYFNT
jgi:hypothetical protein